MEMGALPDPGRVRNRRPRPSILAATWGLMAVDAGGVTSIGFRCLDDAWKRYTTDDGLPDGQVWDLAEGRVGVWAATAGGVTR